MSINIRGRYWQEGPGFMAEVPVLKVEGMGSTISECLDVLKAKVEALSGSMVEINPAEGNCILVSSMHPEFEDYLKSTIQKNMPPH